VSVTPAVGGSPTDAAAGEPLDLPWARTVPDYQCFGCSPHNPHGLGLRFVAHPDGLLTRFRLGRSHESYPGVVHGGLTGVICDETMGNLIVLRGGSTAFTTAMRVRYVSPLLVGESYDCVARLRPATAGPVADGTSADGAAADGAVAGGAVHATAEIRDLDGVMMATARASYQIADVAKAPRNLPRRARTD
jgi:acyl-coenzyme A thioesterase PaaI-like protein